MPLFLPFELSQRWMDEDISVEQYRAILGYEIAPESLEYHTVFTLTGAKNRDDDQPKNARWDCEKLPALGEGNPD